MYAIRSYYELDVVQVTSVSADWIVDREAVNLAHLKVFLAVAGRRVDSAGTGVYGDVVAEDHRHIPIVEGT